MLQSDSQYHSVFVWLAVSASAVLFCKLNLYLDPSKKQYVSKSLPPSPPSSASSLQESNYSPISLVQLSIESTYTKKSMPRTDSEFSIGLGRSTSVEKHLQELGALCDSGRYFISLTRTTVLSIVLCTGAYLTFKGIVYPSKK